MIQKSPSKNVKTADLQFTLMMNGLVTMGVIIFVDQLWKSR